MLALILFAGGLGGAAFHPPAAALAHRLGGTRPGLAMSVHITGGTLGFSLGPLLFAPFAERFGVEWTPLLAIPGLIVDRALSAARAARSRSITVSAARFDRCCRTPGRSDCST